MTLREFFIQFNLTGNFVLMFPDQNEDGFSLMNFDSIDFGHHYYHPGEFAGYSSIENLTVASIHSPDDVFVHLDVPVIVLK